MPPKRLPLKEKFLLSFIVVILTSLLLSITFSYTLFIYNINKRLDPQVIESSQIILDRINDVKNTTLIYGDIIARNADLIDFLRAQKEAGTTLETLTWINGKMELDILQVIDTNGQVVLSVDNPSKIGQNKKTNGLVKRALTGIKTISLEKMDDKYVFIAGIPVFYDNVVIGTILSGFTSDDVLLGKLESSLDEKITIFDEQGQIIATNLKDKAGIIVKEQKIPKEVYEKVAVEGKGITGQIEYDYQKFKVLYTPLSNFEGKTSGILMTAISLNPIVSNNTSTIVTILFSNLITVAIAYLIANISSKRIVDPILTIKKGTEIIGSGNLDYKIVVDTNDESLDLANSFNDMTTKLKDLLREVSDENNKLLTERNKFSIVLEGVQDGILTLDYDRRVSLFNKAAEEITGLKEGEVLGKKCDEIFIIFRNKVRLSASDFCPLIPVVKDQIIFTEKNLKFVSSKKELYVNMNSAVLKNGKLSNLGCIVTFRDSTKERELEDMKLDFVSMAAHELRTPLTSIRGYLSLLEEAAKGRMNEEDKKYLQRVGIASNQLASLVENLLDVAKIEHNTLELDLKKEEWIDVVKSTLENFRNLAEQKEINLNFVEPIETIPQVDVDKFRISEVLSNLLANALNYTEKGGLVEVKIKPRGDFVETLVRDTGCGIPEKSLPHLFTKFYRVSGVLEQGSKGTGLGLFISKSIINMHKGDIWVESRLGVGSTFTFSVPAYKEDSKEIV
ncbi:MAG: ATP-binding protein [Patescibacteria group bacterium]